MCHLHCSFWKRQTVRFIETLRSEVKPSQLCLRGLLKQTFSLGTYCCFCCILFHACFDPPRLFLPQMFVHLHPITASLINCAAWTLCIVFFIYCCLQRLTNYRVHPPTPCCVLLFCSRAGLQLPLIIPLICRVRACSQASEGSGDM